MVLATLVGALLGEVCNMEKGINTLVTNSSNYCRQRAGKASAHGSYIQATWRSSCCLRQRYRCFWRHARRNDGDASILIAKAFLDFFTATIFACTLGLAVSVSVPC